MNVAQMIDWLKTMPYNAEVEVIRHSNRGCGHYEQGGHATSVKFVSDEDYRDDYSLNIDGKLFDLYTDPHGKQTLTIGKLND